MRSFNNVDFYIPEFEQIVAGPDGFPAYCGYVLQCNDFSFYIREFFLVGTIYHFRVEIGENGRPLVLVGMRSVINAEIFDSDPFRHIAYVTKIMLT